MPVANFERREFSFRFSLLFYQVPVIPAKPSAWTGPRNMTFHAEGVSTDTRGGINLTFGEPSNCSRPQRMISGPGRRDSHRALVRTVLSPDGSLYGRVPPVL